MEEPCSLTPAPFNHGGGQETPKTAARTRNKTPREPQSFSTISSLQVVTMTFEASA